MDFNELHALLAHIGIIPKALSKHEAWELFITSTNLNPFATLVFRVAKAKASFLHHTAVANSLHFQNPSDTGMCAGSSQHKAHERRLSMDEHGRGKTARTDISDVSGELSFRMYGDYMYKLLVSRRAKSNRQEHHSAVLVSNVAVCIPSLQLSALVRSY
eukprot:1755297-Rhodomonas_salina.2